MELRPFEEKEVGEWINSLGLHNGAVLHGPHKSAKVLANEEEKLKKNGYKMHVGRFMNMWVADPRGGY